jgi:hypothetical protein
VEPTLMFIANFGLKSFVQKAVMLAHLPLDYGVFHPYRALQARALADTADFVTASMPRALAFDTPKELLDHALAAITLPGIVAEFGVNEGGSINHIAGRLKDRTIDGFDSFEGLPEDWHGNAMAAGYFSRGGKLPKVRPNVRLHAGWFSDSLPRFTATHAGPCAFIHVDCDLYSSTVSIFEGLRDRIVPGTVIVFDEYFNYPNWRAHEHKAFEEFIAATGMAFDYRAYSFKQVMVVMR